MFADDASPPPVDSLNVLVVIQLLLLPAVRQAYDLVPPLSLVCWLRSFKCPCGFFVVLWELCFLLVLPAPNTPVLRTCMSFFIFLLFIAVF